MRESATAVICVALWMRCWLVLAPPPPPKRAANPPANPPRPPPRPPRPPTWMGDWLPVELGKMLLNSVATSFGLAYCHVERLNYRLHLGAVIHRPDDFGQMPDVGLRVGDDNRVAGRIGDNRRLHRDERRQFRDQLTGIHKPDGNDPRRNLVVVGNVGGIIAVARRGCCASSHPLCLQSSASDRRCGWPRSRFCSTRNSANPPPHSGSGACR